MYMFLKYICMTATVCHGAYIHVQMILKACIYLNNFIHDVVDQMTHLCLICELQLGGHTIGKLCVVSN
jgi:hypothetical protein